MSGQETIKALGRSGFEKVSQKGSHVKMRKHTPTETYTAIVPIKKVIRIRTLNSILRQAHLTLEAFRGLLR